MMLAAALSIRVPAQAEQMAPIRAELAEYAEGIGMTATAVENAQTIVTEACGNSIKHAYAREAMGCIEVNAHVEDGELCLEIRDFGPGIGSRTAGGSPSLHAGLLIIGALSRAFRLYSRRDVGTVLEAWMPLETA